MTEPATIVPEALGAAPETLVHVTRGPHVESTHGGWFVVVDSEGRVLDSSADAPRVFARSSAKPFQALPLLRTGAAAAWGFDTIHLALACASHAGEPLHQELAKAMLDKAGVSEKALGCGMHAPFSAPRSAPGLLANNCSGKHAGMLATTRHMGWDVASYLDPAHPLQVMIAEGLAELAGEVPTSEPDGCSAPSWHLSLEGLARALASLARDDDGRRLLDAMASHPVVVAGTGRRDSVLMEVTRGRLVSKGGAEGVTVGLCRESGRAWALKIADGTSRAVGPALVGLLRRHGLMTDTELAADAVSGLASPDLRNHAGRRVGCLRAAGRLAGRL